jgi:hypothetical protein
MEDRVKIDILLDPTVHQAVNVIVEKKVSSENEGETIDIELLHDEECDDTFELDSCLAGMIALDED